MTTTLDLRTLAIVLTLISFALSALMFYVWRSSKTYKGFGWWTAGNAAGALSFLLICGQGTLPTIVSVSFSNMFGVGALLLSYVGIRTFFGRSRRLHLVGGFLAINCIVNLWFLYIVDSVVMRITILSLSVAAIAVLSAAEFQSVPDKHRGRINLVARCSYLFFAVCMILRSALTYFVSPIPNLYSPSSIQSWAFVSFLLFDIFWTFNYLILNGLRLQEELGEAQIELERIAATDYLTGLSNIRAFTERAAIEIVRSHRHDIPLSLVVFDIDHFKAVNDTFGHPAGDKVLKEMAAICSHMTRQSNLIARIGGEEFGLLLTHTDRTGAAIVAENFRKEIENLLVEHDSRHISITSSFGAVELREDDTLESLFARADQNLYHAKDRGRNCVVGEGDDRDEMLHTVSSKIVPTHFPSNTTVARQI